MEILNGRELKKKQLEQLKEKLLKLQQPLGFAVIQVGHNEASNVYIRQKQKMAENLGYHFYHISLEDDILQEELIHVIQELNEDVSIDGILVQMPLPKHIDAKIVQDAIDPEKDIDGLNALNGGKLLKGEDCLLPCTPSGIMTLLHEYQIPICGRHAVIVGRSELVGKPLALLLLNENATVTICHSHTQNLEQYTKTADILVCAVGKKDLIRGDMVKEGVVVIDVGMNRVDGKLYGDVTYDEVAPHCSYITPVPGGVGQMTVSELGENVYRAHQKRIKKEL